MDGLDVNKSGTKASKMIYFYANNNEPYTLSASNTNCYVRDDDGNVATFENISFQENFSVLHIDHFALTTDVRNKGRGMEVLRAFAKVVAKHQPPIQQIKFSLYRRSTGSTESLANGREKLLQRIGAKDVGQEKPNSRDVIVVTGTWYRDDW